MERETQLTLKPIIPTPKNKWRVLLLVLMLVMGVATLIIAYRNQFFTRLNPYPYVSKVSAWVNPAPLPGHSDFTKISEIVVEANNPHERINFEFYSILSKTNMQKNHEEDHFSEDDFVVEHIVEKTPLNPHSPKVKMEINSEELERDFNQKINAKNFVLQLGVFKNLATAQRYQQSLAQAGTQAEILKLKSGNKTVYRLQHGSYVSVGQAKKVQQQLRSKGIACLVRETRSV